MMARFFALVRILLYVQVIARSQPSFHHPSSYATASSTMRPSDNHDGNVLMLRNVSPECWRNAMHVLTLHSDQDDEDKISMLHQSPPTLETSLCSSMTFQHQKAFALELARCHLSDLSRPLFQNEDEESTCNSHDLSTKTSSSSSLLLQHCLSKLSDAGMQSYTHFFTYVHQVCTRLTHEILLNLQEQTTVNLQQASQDATRHFHSFLKRQTDWWQQTQEREKVWNQQHSDMLTQLQEQQRDLVERQAAQLKRQHEEMQELQQTLLRNAEHREARMNHQYQQWMQQYYQQQEQQELKYRQHVQELSNLSKTVDDATLKIKPLLGLETLLAFATTGATYLTSILYCLGAMNAVWLLTLSRRRHCWTVKYMFRIIVLEASLEFLMHWMVSQNLLMSFHRNEGIKLFRTWAFRFECGLYLLGWIVSLLFGQSSGDAPSVVDVTTASNNGTTAEEQLVRRCMEEILAKQQQETREREERLVGLLERQHATKASSPQQPIVVKTPHQEAAMGADESSNHQDSSQDAILPLPPMYTFHQPNYSRDSAYQSLTAEEYRNHHHDANHDESEAFSESIDVSGEDSYNTPDEGWNLQVPDSDLDGSLGLVIPPHPPFAAVPPSVVSPDDASNARKRSRHEDHGSTEDEEEDEDEDMESEPECEEPAAKKIKAT